MSDNRTLFRCLDIQKANLGARIKGFGLKMKLVQDN